MLQKKYPLISKRVAEWKQVGLFLSTQTVLFDLGCINVLKNLKCLDKLKSDSVSFAAKQLLSPRGTSPRVTAGRCTLPTGPYSLRPRSRSSHPTPLPSPSLPEIHLPSQSRSRQQAPSALEQGFSYGSRLSGARRTARHGLRRRPSRPASRDLREHPRSCVEPAGKRQQPNGWRTTDIAPALEPRPSPESVMKLR